VGGFSAGKIPALPFNLPLLKGGVLTGVDLAQINRREPATERRVTDQLLRWLKEKRLVPVVGQVFALGDFREAFKTMQTRAALGKMVVRIS
jgi:NADPH2:quinone reductase